MSARAVELRDRARTARLALLFTPAAVGGRDPLDVLDAALPYVDMVQVRIKHPEDPSWASPAADLHLWTRRVLERRAATGRDEVLVVVNDRVDVAACLEREGVDGVHLGTGDAPASLARAVLAPETLVGVSTHDGRQLAAADADAGVDYVGFGPIHPTPTKGYATGLGAEAAWVAANATRLPVYPIGGIDATNADQLAPVGRAAVSSAILLAPDPGAAARELRELLEPEPLA